MTRGHNHKGEWDRPYHSPHCNADCILLSQEAVKEVESSKPAPAAESKPAAPSAPKSSAPVSESKSEAAAAAAAPKEKPAAKAASSGNGSSVDKDTLKSILVEMCDKLSSMKASLC